MKMEEMRVSGPDNTKLETLMQDIYSELVEDACLGLCFEVHRAAKQGYFFLDETDQESMKEFEIVDQPGVDVFGKGFSQWKNKECECPSCRRLIAASRFAPHLEKCLGMGRNSSRIASRRLASNNNTSKSESDQEDNDDANDNDWSYGAEKKAKKRKSEKNQNSPRRSKPLKHKNGELGSISSETFKYNCNTGINYESLGPDEIRSVLTTQCGVISEHTKKMCNRPALPDVEPESNSFEAADGPSLMSRLQWDDSSDISPADSASSKASTNHSDSRRPKNKKPALGLSGAAGSGGLTEGGGGGGSQSHSGLPTKKKKPKISSAFISSIYDDLN
ncbi:ataxin-7-like protein 3 isoform X2 [Austrofundulus limnaeus]|uniref:Ataxin-7-like protein 3 n=1 Tax=Austrofundulus limnaeus TaxID=52670 RepID=A0A2I4CCL7_AUSLI|nr:PREDICTED: ataxin-7-like protein 3 isoform X2 [Austrofundulus limnaeus]